ncbi:MAG: NYN domain-containing protein [Gemmatimonadaceae bacterium]
MHPRSSRHGPSRGPVAPLHRGPQAMAPGQLTSPLQHAPNAALLIDFDNVTMGIRSDLASELRSLLSSEIIKGKVAVQRAYADWRRYPQYIVPLAESSIDMIMAPAYGSSKKNATDIRLAVDAMELVFTRAEIGTYILLSGDSDFASLVTKLKEYGKYVIGVGIRESSSDLLVMNCDEYYSYNALAGLVKSTEEEVVKWDPWELVVEAVTRMTKNGDVMRSDRLKQVMQDIDATFDEKNLGMSKFSRFVQEAATRGLVTITKLENGQLEVGAVNGVGAGNGASVTLAPRATNGGAPAEPAAERPPREERGGRRGRRGRGRDRDRDRGEARDQPMTVTGETAVPATPVVAEPVPSRPATNDGIGLGGERLTKQEAFDLVTRTVKELVGAEGAALAGDVRRRAFQLLGRDSESLAERNFFRILRDAHDAEVVDLRRHGDDYDVALPAAVAPVAEQLNRAAQAHAAAAPSASTAPAAPRGMGPRGIPGRGRTMPAPPPELLSVGVVETAPAAAPVAADAKAEAAPAKKGRTARSPRGKTPAKPKAAPAKAVAEEAPEAAPAAKKRTRRGGRGRKKATAESAE